MTSDSSSALEDKPHKSEGLVRLIKPRLYMKRPSFIADAASGRKEETRSSSFCHWSNFEALPRRAFYQVPPSFRVETIDVCYCQSSWCFWVNLRNLKVFFHHCRVFLSSFYLDQGNAFPFILFLIPL